MVREREKRLNVAPPWRGERSEDVNKNLMQTPPLCLSANLRQSERSDVHFCRRRAEEHSDSELVCSDCRESLERVPPNRHRDL